jgi:hypothetical protein
VSDYPLPSYVAQIWTMGDRLVLRFPSPVDAPAHTVEFPVTQKGLELALATLREREKSKTPAWLATKAAPTKYQIERVLVEDKKYKAWLKEMTEAKEKRLKEAEDADLFLRELGLIPIKEKKNAKV